MEKRADYVKEDYADFQGGLSGEGGLKKEMALNLAFN